MTEQTRGEYMMAVGVDPSAFGAVQVVKEEAASLINAIEEQVMAQLQDVDAFSFLHQEKLTLKEMSIRQVEMASMLAVKALTKPPVDE